MFDIGFTEILLIGVVSLVVIGPERLPDVARTAGRWIGKMQRFVRGVKTDIANELDSAELKRLIGDQRDQIDELRKMVGSTTRELESSTRDIVSGARKKLTELEDAAARADGEADADADVARPAGSGVSSAPTSSFPADGSAAAAAKTIGGRAPGAAAAGAASGAAADATSRAIRDTADVRDAVGEGSPRGVDDGTDVAAGSSPASMTDAAPDAGGPPAAEDAVRRSGS